jgi:hypothetical protein
MVFSLYFFNSSNSAASFSNIIFQLASSNGNDYYNEIDYHIFTLPISGWTTITRSCIVNNPASYNFTLSFTPTYTGGTGSNGISYSSSGNVVSPQTYLQFIKIG